MVSRRIYSLPLCWLCAVICAAPASGVGSQPLPEAVEFNRDIRPIFSDNCFNCHGPDKAKRKVDFRLDTEEGAFARRKDGPVIVPGKPQESELFRRITSEDEAERMPQGKSGRRLSEREVALIRRWIEQGAKWQQHWAFLPPQGPLLPPVQRRDWPRNGIDYFILARLQEHGLSPSREADKTTLIRRVTLDLTGLPPTPAEVNTFLADQAPDAYEKLVDRLLASPRYGERMARPWLDAARYADTNGYQTDGERYMWRWRDWVIDAYNQNKPFDQFTIEQIAGDMLPNAALEQKIATGFNRNHRGNAEGGIIPEEYAVEYVVDRVDTTFTVWLGLTMGCGRCHDHKYDPLKQREFYQVFAYFNNVPERGRALKYGNSPPVLQTPTRQQQRQLHELQQKMAAAERRFAMLAPEITAAQTRWEKSLPGAQPIQWTISNGLIAHYPLDGSLTEASGAQNSSGLYRSGKASFVTGRIGQAASFDGRCYIDAGNVADLGFYDKVSLAAWVKPRAKGGTVLSRMTDQHEADGYYVCIESGKVQVNLVKRWLDDAIRVETERCLPSDEWHHVLVTYDGLRVAAGVRVYIDGRPEKLNVLLDDLNQSFDTKEPFRIGGGNGPQKRFHGLIDDVRIYHRALSPEEAAIVATTDSVCTIAAAAPAGRSTGQAAKIRHFFLERQAPETIRAAHHELTSLRRAYAALVESLPTTMVMEEMPKPRDAFVLVRGQYDRRGEKVNAGVPAVLQTSGANTPGSPAVPNNRLGFAKWLVDPANPLTARVAVNRYWQMYFGIGLVKTVEDFGTQGEWPSHPELLDWLATEFMRRGWDIKTMQRLIVTSATYRQSSHLTPTLRNKDPENRLLARGPRLRLSAEAVRDQALAASGLLVERVGGPSVKPYQPPALWKELSDTDYQQDHGPSLYRRSLYTFWKRTVPPPSMMNFDAAGREACIVHETRTNTPLQALDLMNDVTYVEASRALAQRVLQQRQTPDERIMLAFRMLTARPPKSMELRILLEGLQNHLAEYRHNVKAALKLVTTGEFPRDPKLDVSELAAYTALASLILNLDETITKE
jgi:hypothetical protein